MLINQPQVHVGFTCVWVYKKWPVLLSNVLLCICVCVNASRALWLLFSRLHEQEERFKPTLSAFDFQHFLYNLTNLQISNAGGRNCECATVGVRVHTCNHAWSSPVFRFSFAQLSQLGISDSCMSQKVNMILLFCIVHNRKQILFPDVSNYFKSSYF